VAFGRWPRAPAQPARDARPDAGVEDRPEDEPDDQVGWHEHRRHERGPELRKEKQRQEIPLRPRDDARARIGGLRLVQERLRVERQQTQGYQHHHRQDRVGPEMVGKVRMRLVLRHVVRRAVRWAAAVDHAGSAGPWRRAMRRWRYSKSVITAGSKKTWAMKNRSSVAGPT